MAMHHTISRRDATAPPWPSRRMPAASGRHQPAPEATRVVMWGTYDISKPRNRILVEGLRQAGVELIECHAEVWAGVEDKSQVAAWWPRLRLLLCWLACYPALVVRYMCLPSHDAVVRRLYRRARHPHPVALRQVAWRADRVGQPDVAVRRDRR